MNSEIVIDQVQRLLMRNPGATKKDVADSVGISIRTLEGYEGGRPVKGSTKILLDELFTGARELTYDRGQNKDVDDR